MADSPNTPPTGPDDHPFDHHGVDQQGSGAGLPDSPAPSTTAQDDGGPAAAGPSAGSTGSTGSHRVEDGGGAHGMAAEAPAPTGAVEPDAPAASTTQDEPADQTDHTDPNGVNTPIAPVEPAEPAGVVDTGEPREDAEPGSRRDERIGSSSAPDAPSAGAAGPDTAGHRVDDITPLAALRNAAHPERGTPGSAVSEGRSGEGPADGPDEGPDEGPGQGTEAAPEVARPDTSSAEGAPVHERTPVHEGTAGSTTAAAALPPGAARDRHTSGNPVLDRDAARRAAVRDGVITARPPFPRFLQVVVALFFPVIVLAAAVRAVATSSFLWIEYNRPGFPADRFGFSLEDRMTYGSYALDYVLNFAPPRYLGDLTTADGAPLFLETEVGHMADVKSVLGVAFAVALVMFVLAVLACIHLARRYKGGIRRALFAGAVITLVGIVALAVLAVTAWETFFTQVHALFFPEGTWTFRVDDTLIRLFPEQFWTDSAVIVGLLVAVATLLTLVLTWPTRARRERSRRAQEAEQTRYLESLRST